MKTVYVCDHCRFESPDTEVMAKHEKSCAKIGEILDARVMSFQEAIDTRVLLEQLVLAGVDLSTVNVKDIKL